MKKSLIFALALMLVLAFASSAMAAQVLQDGSYLSTTALGMSRAGNPADSTFSRTYLVNKFKADGITNYPYEIYLPNEKNTHAYRIHSSYTKNTDACASCHSTHTALGANLLQWYSAYETCLACHDGTVTTTYDVVTGVIGTTGKPTFGGMFGTGTEGSLSNHNVTGALSIAAAPGGSVVETTVQVGHNNQKIWTPEFGCESCHTPHGLGGNARLLHPDANYFATDRATKKGWFGMVDNHDNKGLVVDPNKKGITFNVYGEDVSGKVYFAYVEPAGTVGAGVYNSGNGLYILTGYPYSTIIKVYGANITAAYRKDFTIDNTLGYSRVMYNGNDASVMNASYASKVVVIGVPSVKVTMQIDKYLGYANTTEAAASSTENVTHKDGMNVFCGTCHTDYNTMSDENWVADPITGAMKFTGSDKKETGVYSKAHRHQMGFNWYMPTGGLAFETGYRMECLTCHVAHGTSTDYWNRTLVTNAGGPVKGPDGTAWTAGTNNANLQELAGSSALKRMPNMGTCEACHAMENGNQGYAVNSGQTPNPLDATPDPNQADPAGLGNSQFFIGAAITTPATYVGSAACSGCHADVYSVWKSTYTDASGVRIDHGHASTNSFKANKGRIGTNGQSCDHANDLTGNWGVTEYSCHGIGNNVAFGAGDAFGTVVSKVGVPDSFRYGYEDAGITCEVCHLSGAKHVKAPSAKNIFNPGRQTVGNLDLFQSQTLACLKCHGVIKGTEGSTGAANATTILNVNTVDAAQVAALGRVPLGVHASSSQNYSDSKHYTLGIATCITCHDPHESKGEPETKLPYGQLCISCHDSAGTIMNTMGTNGATHSFKFGMAGQTGPIASAEFVIQRPKTNITENTFSGTLHKNTGLWNTLTGTGITDGVTADVSVTGASVRVKDAAGNYIVTNQDKITGFSASVDSHGATTYAVKGKLTNLTLNGTPIASSSVAGKVYISSDGQKVIFDKTATPIPAATAYEGNYGATWTADFNPAITVTGNFYTVY